MLLPGTSAKLEPPEDCTFLDGERHMTCPDLLRQWLLLCPHKHAGPLWAGRDCCVGNFEASCCSDMFLRFMPW